MPVKKTTFKRRRFFKRKPSAKMVKAVANVIKRKDEERKYIDLDSQNAAYSFSGTVIPISSCVQGTTALTRIADQINPISLNIRGRLIGNGANVANTTQVARFMVFRDKFSNGAAPAVADVLQITGSNDIVYSPLNVNNLGRFIVLYDKMVTFDNQTLALGNASASGSVRCAPIHVYRKLKYSTRYKANNGTVADYLSNGYFVLICGNVNTNDISVEFYSRITFTDA